MVIGLLWYLSERSKDDDIKNNGTRVLGTIINNKELILDWSEWDRLGGNINNPTVRFMTLEGREIIGKPIARFVTQYEVKPPANIYIIYDTRNPQRFRIDEKQ